jgi:hypothetical protein
MRSASADFEAARALGSLAALAELRDQPELAVELCEEALRLHSGAGTADFDEGRDVRSRLDRLGGGAAGEDAE